MDYKELIYSVSNHVLTLTFNKPDKLNAFGPEIEGLPTELLIRRTHPGLGGLDHRHLLRAGP